MRLPSTFSVLFKLISHRAFCAAPAEIILSSDGFLGAPACIRNFSRSACLDCRISRASYPTKLNIEYKIRSFRERGLSIAIHKFSDRSGSGNRLLRSLCSRTKMTKFQARDRQNLTKTINAFHAYGAMAAFRLPALRLQPQYSRDRSHGVCTWDQPVHGD